jgi:CRISPR-associated protein Cas1
MIKRIIEISQAKTYLSVKNDQLIIKRDDQQVGQIPCEDIGMLIVDSSGVTYTHGVFTTLLKSGSVVVLCGRDHHPAGLLLPTESNSLQTARMRSQLMAKEPIKKQIWKQLIIAKIKHQAKILSSDSAGYKKLVAMSKSIKIGDPENKEAQASKLYWQHYVSQLEFRRQRHGSAPNNLLNYGYAILRAAIARAVVAAGLNPSIGVHHHNKYNAFCLADDLMEPFRGFVDEKVLEIWADKSSDNDYEELDQPTKARLLEILYKEVEIGQYAGPLMVGLHRTAASLIKCFEGEQTEVNLPKIDM